VNIGRLSITVAGWEHPPQPEEGDDHSDWLNIIVEVDPVDYPDLPGTRIRSSGAWLTSRDFLSFSKALKALAAGLEPEASLSSAEGVLVVICVAVSEKPGHFTVEAHVNAYGGDESHRYWLWLAAEELDYARLQINNVVRRYPPSPV
jgi:hypothetical protein